MELAIAIVALLTGLAGLATVLRTKRTVNEIHVLTNDRLTKVTDRVEQLTTTLIEAGIVVPDSPPIPPSSTV